MSDELKMTVEHKGLPAPHIGVPLALLVSNVGERAAQIIDSMRPSPARTDDFAAWKAEITTAVTDAINAACDAAWAMKR